MPKRARLALLLALLLLAALFVSSVLPALHAHEGCAAYCPVCRLICRAERLFSGLACALAALGLCAALLALRRVLSAALPPRSVSPVRLRVKLTN